MFPFTRKIASARPPLVIAVTIACALPCSAIRAAAQNTYGGSIELHANDNATASSIGLPDLPRSRPYSDSENDAAGDMGFTFGDVHFRILIAKFLTSTSPAQVLDFYRKPLSRYGDVIECMGGEPVGPLTHTRGGLGCSDDDDAQGSHAHDRGSSHELRAGTRERFRVVSIDTPRNDSTRFVLMYMEVPKHESSGGHR